ncbi:MAG: FAD-binding domain-containing protein [Pseudomonadota bacterium]
MTQADKPPPEPARPEQLDLIGDRAPPAAGPIAWTPTRAAGLARLNTFAPSAGRAYASTRNYDYGPEARGNVSALSPWVRARLVLEREVLDAALSRHASSAAEKFVQEVYWRAYFKGSLENRPSVWRAYREGVAADLERLDATPALARAVGDAVDGRTGIDCFDAWARELIETGYLHNHARMWFASIWIFTLRLPWRLGADFFYRHLLDGDPASNTLSWRWVGGLHTKGKTYLATASNIARYTEGRFAPTGLAHEAPALTEDDTHAIAPPPLDAAAPTGPDVGLLITEEDCAADGFPIDAPRAAIGLTATAARSPGPVGEKAHAFTTGAVADALSRVRAAAGCDVEQRDTGDWGAALADWTARNGVRTIAAAYQPVGPSAERLGAAAPALRAAGLTLVTPARPYDRAVWPYATKGFFHVKKKIPTLLRDHGLS